jgi:hypothetical protein
VPLLAGLALLGGFVAHEGRVPVPLIPLVTLRKRSLLFANLAAGLLWASFLGLIYHATLFVQQVQGYSPLAAGASTIPIAVLSLAVSARLAPRVIGRLGAAPALAVGMAVQGAGLLLLARVPENVTFLIDLLPAYAVVGIGLGLAQVAVQIAALAGVAADEANRARGRPSLDRPKRRRAGPSPPGRPSVEARPLRGRRAADAGRHAIGLLDIGARVAPWSSSTSSRRPVELGATT